MKTIEMRSDTFTLPTQEMLTAIQEANLGDDVYGEDSTVIKLQQLAANMLGMEESLLMPSGTMANLSSILAHCPRGSKVLVSDESDIYIYEAAGASVCGGIMYEPIHTEADGSLSLINLEKSFPHELDDPQFALPALICIENPHNRMGGRILPISYLQELRHFAKKKNISIHLDGARLFNAAVALNINVSEITKHVDSVQICLSKGLSAPIGSIVAGKKDFIEKVRRIRKMLGGGMRQAGIIAAPGIVALQSMVNRLHVDHENALYFAKGLSNIKGIEINVEDVEINMVFFRINHAAYTWSSFINEVDKYGLKLSELGHDRIRAVIHSGITRDDIDRALSIIIKTLN